MRYRYDRIALILCLVLGSLTSFLPPTWAVIGRDNFIGGPGGAPFRADCGPYGVLVGVVGRAGVVVDQVAGLCMKVDPVSRTLIGQAYETTHYGGNGGQSFTKKCPANQAMWGIEGNLQNFMGYDVVASLQIRCIELGLLQYESVIAGKRLLRAGETEPDPRTVKVYQAYCDFQKREEWQVYGLAIALEGASGTYLDRLRPACAWIPAEKTPYGVEFHATPQSPVLEGTPLGISWRGTSVKPDLMANLVYSWLVLDWTHTTPSALFPIPTATKIADPCRYVMQPCNPLASAPTITILELPPARYELQVSVHVMLMNQVVSAPVGGGSVSFEITPNLLLGLTMNPSTIRPGQSSTATIILQGPASRRGKTVHLSSSNPQVAPVPASVVVPGGRTRIDLPIKTDPIVSAAGPVTLTASVDDGILSALRSSPVQPNLVLPRGVDIPDSSSSTLPAAATPETESSSQPHNVTVQPMPSASVTDQDIAERGILQSAGTLPPSRSSVVPLPPPAPGPSGGANVATPFTQVSPTVNLPSKSKQAILRFESNPTR